MDNACVYTCTFPDVVQEKKPKKNFKKNIEMKTETLLKSLVMLRFFENANVFAGVS